MNIHFTTNLDICKQDVSGLNVVGMLPTLLPTVGTRIQLAGYELEVIGLRMYPPNRKHMLPSWECIVELHIPKWFPNGIKEWESVVLIGRKHYNGQ